jgi:manganese/zinc/iron transport system permease protein
MTDWIQMLVLSSVAISCGLLGPFLVLRKMTMFANALSHTILIGIALAFLITGSYFALPSLLIGALIAAFMTAFFTGGLVRFFKLTEDASIGLVFTTLFALGVAVVTLFMRDVHLGLEAVMGNADIVTLADLKLTFSLVGINLLSIVLFFRQLQITSFDQGLAKTLGIRCSVFQFFLLFLVAMTCIGAFRAVGVLLVLAFLVGPYLIARKFCNRLPWLLLVSPLIGVGTSILGVLVSRLCLEWFDLPLSTGGIVTSLLGLIFILSRLGRFTKMPACKRELPS